MGLKILCLFQIIDECDWKEWAFILFYSYDGDPSFMYSALLIIGIFRCSGQKLYSPNIRRVGFDHNSDRRNFKTIYKLDPSVI